MPPESTLKKFELDIEKLLISSDSHENVLFTGRQGWGKREIMRILRSGLESRGFITLEGRTEASMEVEKYEPFNQILDYLTGTTRIRELSEILKEMDLKFLDGKKRFIFLTNVNLLSDPTRHLITYFLKNSKKYGVSIICSCSTDSELRNGNLKGFLDIVNAEQLARVVSLGRPSIEDFEYVLDKSHFPKDFLTNIYRLSDSNFMILDYVLKYYTSKGMITASGKLDYRVYRFFIIPKEISVFLSSVVEGMNETEKMVLAMISFSETFMTSTRISELLGIDEKIASDICQDLTRIGIATELSSNYGVSSRFLNQFLSQKLPEGLLLTALRKARDSPVFKKLPVENRIRFLEKLSDFKGLSDLIKGEWRTFIRKFTNVESTLSFVQRVQEKITEPETKKILSLIRCNAIYNGDDLEMARKCYETGFAYEVDPVGVILTLASIYQSLNRYEKSIEVLEQLEGMKDVEPGPTGFSHLLISEASFANDDLERCREEALLSLKAGEEIHDEELTARSLTVLGNERLVSGFPVEAESYYRKSLELNRKLGIWLQISRNLNNLSAMMEKEGRFSEAEECLIELIDNTYITGDVTLRSSAFHSLARLLDLKGKRTEVQEFARKSLSTASISSNTDLVMRCHSLLFWHHLRDLSLSKAMGSLNEALKEKSHPMIKYFESLRRNMEIIDGGSVETTYGSFPLSDIPDEFDRMQYIAISELAQRISGRKIGKELELANLLKEADDGTGILPELLRITPESIKKKLNLKVADSDGAQTSEGLFRMIQEAYTGSISRSSGEECSECQRFTGILRKITDDFISLLDGKMEREAFQSSMKLIWVE